MGYNFWYGTSGLYTCICVSALLLGCQRAAILQLREGRMKSKIRGPRPCPSGWGPEVAWMDDMVLNLLCTQILLETMRRLVLLRSALLLCARQERDGWARNYGESVLDLTEYYCIKWLKEKKIFSRRFSCGSLRWSHLPHLCLKVKLDEGYSPWLSKGLYFWWMWMHMSYAS